MIHSYLQRWCFRILRAKGHPLLTEARQERSSPMAFVRASRDVRRGGTLKSIAGTNAPYRAMHQVLSKLFRTRCEGNRRHADALHMHRHADAADIAEHAQVSLDLGRIAGRLLRIVGEFDGGPAIDRRHLADDRDWIEIDRAIGRA